MECCRGGLGRRPRGLLSEAGEGEEAEEEAEEEGEERRAAVRSVWECEGAPQFRESDVESRSKTDGGGGGRGRKPVNERFGLWQERLPQPLGKKGSLIGGSVRVSSLSRFHTAVRVGFYFFRIVLHRNKQLCKKHPT